MTRSDVTELTSNPAAMREARALLDLARRSIPSLGPNGVGDPAPFTDDLLRQIIICAWWVRTHMRPRKTRNDHRSSYGLKHSAEGAYGTYVCNGAFIAATVGLGYRWYQPRRVTLNYPNPDRFPNVWFHASYRRCGCDTSRACALEGV